MRIFHKPVMQLFTGPKLQGMQAQSPAADAGAEQAAKDEAARKEREAAGQRQGVRSTILTGSDTQQQFLGLPKRRSTVLGATA